MHYFGLAEDSTLEQLLVANRQFCATPWSQLAVGAATVKNTDRYCFRAHYVALLLRDGLQLLDSQVTPQRPTDRHCFRAHSAA
jgi:hypothetical protein